MQPVATVIVMAMTTVMAIMVIPKATGTITMAMDTPTGITIVTGMVIVDHGVGPVIGDETRKRPLPMGHNSNPLAKPSI